MPGSIRGVNVGAVPLGGGAPISVQSMTNTPTADVEATLAQIKALAGAGCDIVRVSVYDTACAGAVRQLVEGSPVPLVADIHFDHRLAIATAENGIAKLRVNPGNIGGEVKVRALADCLKAHHIPVRIGVNSGSLEKALLDKYGGATPEAMVESALSHARMLEKCGFYDIVLSLKASDIARTVQANRLARKRCDYPLHLGVTEAGMPGMGTLKGAIGIGALLVDGIGDTVRVSLSGDPLPEAEAGIQILRALGLRGGADIIACPTCGRCAIDVHAIARRVEAETRDFEGKLKVAVMGCVVNGPGEAREADIALAGGGLGKGALYANGKLLRAVDGDLAQALIDEIRAFTAAV